MLRPTTYWTTPFTRTLIPRFRTRLHAADAALHTRLGGCYALLHGTFSHSPASSLLLLLASTSLSRNGELLMWTRGRATRPPASNTIPLPLTVGPTTNLCGVVNADSVRWTYSSCGRACFVVPTVWPTALPPAQFTTTYLPLPTLALYYARRACVSHFWTLPPAALHLPRHLLPTTTTFYLRNPTVP